MNAFRIALAALSLAGAGAAQAIEITEFPDSPSVRSRAEVQAEAHAAARAGQLRYDFVGRAVEPMSVKSREEVRAEAQRRVPRDELKTLLFVGGR